MWIHTGTSCGKEPVCRRYLTCDSLRQAFGKKLAKFDTILQAPPFTPLCTPSVYPHALCTSTCPVLGARLSLILGARLPLTLGARLCRTSRARAATSTAPASCCTRRAPSLSEHLPNTSTSAHNPRTQDREARRLWPRVCRFVVGAHPPSRHVTATGGRHDGCARQQGRAHAAGLTTMHATP